MTALQPLNSLYEQSCAARDEVLADQQRAAAALLAAQTQAEQLVAYRREYAQRFGTPSSRPGGVELLQYYQGFMQRLDEAVAQQQRVVERASHEVDAIKDALLSAELRVASVRKLIERRVSEAVRTQERGDQKQTDEFAARAAWQRMVGGAGAAAFGAV